jgi:sRNA-binding regulator protein Hfq
MQKGQRVSVHLSNGQKLETTITGETNIAWTIVIDNHTYGYYRKAENGKHYNIDKP